MLRATRQFARSLSTKPRHTGPAFVFDIDGVLVRGRNVIPGAPATLQSLYNPSTGTWRAPVTFLTNGGGMTEAMRANQLTSLLDVPISESQIVLAHTPMCKLVSLYNSRGAIVTVGGSRCSDVARGYGFHHVIDAETLAALNPASTPFARLNHVEPSSHDRDIAKMPVVAVFVMADCGDWGRDIQVLLDILCSTGDSDRTRIDQQFVDIYFSNPDIIFPNEHHIPRLAGGSFRIALEAIYKRVTGQNLRAVQFGKPHAPNYDLAESLLAEQTRLLGFCERNGPESIYAIGDNPASDVRGANARGGKWVSVLVRTGNFAAANESHTANDPIDPAEIVADDVAEAVGRVWERHQMSDVKAAGTATFSPGLKGGSPR